MLYCPPNITLSQVWVNNGISHCLLDTVGMSVVAGFILLFGTLRLSMYRKQAIRVKDPTRISKLQIFLLAFFPIISIIRLILMATVYDNATVYGYMILSVMLISIAYTYSIVIVVKEQLYQLTSTPTGGWGHGLVMPLFWTLASINESMMFINHRQDDWWFNLKSSKDKFEMGLFVCRFLCSLLIFVLGFTAPGLKLAYKRQGDKEPLHADGNRSAFHNSWKTLLKMFKYIWPRNNVLVQLAMAGCIILMIAGRFVGIYIHIYSKKLVDSLTVEPINFRWDLVLVNAALIFLQGSGTGTSGLLGNIHTFLWLRVKQHVNGEIEVDLFAQLINKSLRWHLQRNTGEVLTLMDSGAHCITHLMRRIIFYTIPAIIDSIVAVIFLMNAFNWWFGLVVLLTIFLYILSAFLITEWESKFEFRMDLDVNERSVDSLLNFETVKYYGAEQYEVDAFREAILKQQKEALRSMYQFLITDTLRDIIKYLGLLIGSLLCVHAITNSHVLTAGDYFNFCAYIMQLYWPLLMLGQFYHVSYQDFIHVDDMFNLLMEEEEVRDAPGAPKLLCSGGKIEFSNVTFGYNPEKIVLRNISFTVNAGKTVAIVGPSGAGKSTIVRLLFRFYDVNHGKILVDGQNIKLIQQESLRKCIGVVPQDTVLFNNTVFYNIEYGHIGSTADQVVEAARNGDIHERILSFPDRYETKVGERGLRLSGGEKQRVAIARTLLKAPAIVLLDEATSALDTQTERNIQSALAKVCANRTTMIIAHRLSTIVHADEILVLKDGGIVERGRHKDLVQQNGFYADMWNQQIQNLDAGGTSSDSETDKADIPQKTLRRRIKPSI